MRSFLHRSCWLFILLVCACNPLPFGSSTIVQSNPLNPLSRILQNQSLKTNSSAKAFQFKIVSPEGQLKRKLAGVDINGETISIREGERLTLNQLPRESNWQLSSPALGKIEDRLSLLALKSGVTGIFISSGNQSIAFTLVILDKQSNLTLPPTLKLPDRLIEEINTGGNGSSTNLNGGSSSDSTNLEENKKNPTASPLKTIPSSGQNTPIQNNPTPTQPFNPEQSLNPIAQLQQVNATEGLTTITLSWLDTQNQNTIGYNLYLNGKLLPPTGTLTRQSSQLFSYTFTTLESNQSYVIGIAAITNSGEQDPVFVNAKTLSFELSKPGNDLSISPGSQVELGVDLTELSHLEIGKVEFRTDKNQLLKDINGNFLTVTPSEASSVRWDSSAFSSDVNILAILKDPAGNTIIESHSRTISFRSSATTTTSSSNLILTDLTPSQGYADPDFTFIINGVNLESQFPVAIGGVTVSSVEFISGNQIKVTLPASISMGTYTVTVNSQSVPTSLVLNKKRHFVNDDATGNNDGTTWVNAFTDLQNALSTAISGEEIWMAKGTYKPTSGTDRSATFTLKSGVTIYGSLTVGQNDLAARDFTGNAAILSGDLNGDDVGFTNNAENSFHVVTGVNNAVLNGVTISGGHANGGGVNNEGAGMYNLNVSPSLSWVTFTSNSAVDGGAMMNDNATLTLDEVTFTGNQGTNNGGAIHNKNNASTTLNNATFTNNIAGVNGGGIYGINATISLTNSTFNTNIAITSGGSILLHQASNLTVDNSTFDGNSATAGGGLGSGGAIVGFNTSNVTISNSTFSNNSATGRPGAVYIGNTAGLTINDTNFNTNNAGDAGGAVQVDQFATATLTNVTFTGNTATNIGGGAMLLEEDATATLNNCTFNNNSSPGRGGAIKVLRGETRLNLNDTTFINNSANGAGGAINFNQNNQTNTFNRVIFHNNQSTTGNGGVIQSTNGTGAPPHIINISNGLFSNNQAGNQGGVFYHVNNGSTNCYNCTFANNSSTSNGGVIRMATGVTVDIDNGIFFNNTAPGGPIAQNSSGTLTIDFSYVPGIGFPDVGGTAGSGANNQLTAVNPFINSADPDGADNTFKTNDDGLRLAPASLALNNGTTGGPIPTVDLLNTARPGVNNDMGAYEQ